MPYPPQPDLPAHLLLKGYYLKRVSKGYVFRTSPKPWEGLLEKPGGGVEILGKYKDKPLLRDVAKVRTYITMMPTRSL